MHDHRSLEISLRDSLIEKLSYDCFDVLIIGGGINGSVAAAALSARGANVALVDKGDFACLTSQNSSNLVWEESSTWSLLSSH